MRPNSVVITGALQGLGFEVGKFFLMNSDLRLCLIDKHSVHESERFLELNYPNRYSIYYADLSVASETNDVAEKIISEVDPVVLINNLGPRTKVDLTEETADSFSLMLDTILVSNFLLSRAFLINAKERDISKLRIVNVGSVLADLVGPQSPSYHVAKGALQSLTRYFSIEGKTYISDLSVILIQPGFIVQERYRPRFESIENSNFRRIIQHYNESNYIFSDEDVASNIFHLSMHDASSLINGHTINLDYSSGNREHLHFLFSQDTKGP
jgi:NAD(P)-dependent dehydrogenase (short-subunit alcohol dehydrogenase family)